MKAIDFDEALRGAGAAVLRRRTPTTLQLNLTTRCNLACHHCHVESGPKRTESMDARGATRVLEVLRRNPVLRTLDLTGGAPELNPHFRELVTGARDLGRRVLDRCNLTVFWEPGQEDTPEFLARNGVGIIASLPCHSLENVDGQRGRGVFDRSIEALRRLNTLGYGRGEGAGDSGLRLDLVYNPTGPFLPPAQAELENDYRRELAERFDIRFDQLLTITNMPIKRFAQDLHRAGQSEAYQRLLVDGFNPSTVDGLMCRDLISVDHEGRFYDCDFNQALGLPMAGGATLWSIDSVAALEGGGITTGEHCFGCTAGAGSSCGGALRQ